MAALEIESMDNLKDEFIRLAIDCQVLKFGEFTLKSGRKSPYFFNAGLFYQGKALRRLGQFYAKALISSGINFQHLFGPAYKGLPLATSTALALAEVGVDVTVTFNRKEAKDHGEGGQLIGSPLTGGNTVMIDDVITAGTAFREALSLIEHNGGHLEAVIIALNRCERSTTSAISTLKEIENQGIRVLSLINFFDLVEFLRKANQMNEVERLLNYHQEYGG